MSHAGGMTAVVSTGEPRLGIDYGTASTVAVLAWTAVPVGAFVAVADFGAGFEATVLRRGPSGFEVLATVAAADAGGDRLDAALAAHLTALVQAADLQAADTAAGTDPDPPPPAP